MSNASDLIIRLLVDDDEMSKFDSASTKAEKFGAGLDIAARGAAVTVAALGTAAVITGVAASNAQQSAGAVDSVFADSAGQIHEWASVAADAVGLTTTDYSNLAAVVGSQFQNMGVPIDEVAGKTNNMITLGADLAATYGGTTADAVSALSALLRGESDPIEQYGVSIKEADINAQLAASGLAGLEGEAGKAARTQAVLTLLTEQTGAAQGQFAREADTAAGSSQIMQAKVGDAAAELGTILLPILAEGAELLGAFADWAKENADTVQVLAVGAGVLAGAVLAANAAFKGMMFVQSIGQALGLFKIAQTGATVATTGQTAAQWANNAAWLASPVTWIILAIIVAIGLLVAAVIWLASNWDGVAAWIGEVWSGFMSWITGVIDGFVGWWNDIWTGVGQFLADAWNGAVGFVVGLWEGYVGWLYGILTGFVTFWQDIWTNVSNFFSDVWNGYVDIVRGVWNGILGWIEGGVNGAIGLINGMIEGVNAIGGAIGIHLDFIPNVHLPRLATGGVTYGPMVAMIGDNPGGREVVQPVGDYERTMLRAFELGRTQTPRQQDRPIYADGIGLIGWVREIADERAELVWAKGDAAMAAVIRAGAQV